MIFNTSRREPGVPGDRVQAGRLLLVEDFLHPLGRLAGALLGRAYTRSEPPWVAARRRRRRAARPSPSARTRSAARGTSSARDRSCRTAAARSGGAGAGTPASRCPSSLTSARSPAAKPRMSGTWAKTLLATTRSARPCRRRSAAGLRTEELDLGRDAAGPGRLGDVRGRLDAEHGDAARAEVLQEIAVVARDLDDEALRGQPEAARSSRPRTAGRARPTSPSTRRSTRSRRRSPRRTRTRAAGRAGTQSTPGHAAGRRSRPRPAVLGK